MLTAQTIDRVTQFDGGGLPVLSLYVPIPVDPAARMGLHSRVNSLLDDVRQLGKSDGSLERAAALSLREDVQRVDAAAADDHWAPAAVAVFSCSGAGLFVEIRLPRWLDDRVLVDTTPWVRPMRAILDEYHRYCVAVLDATDAHLWELYLGEMVEARRVHDPGLRKADYAGWHGVEEHRVRNRAENLAKLHYRRLAGELDELFRRDRYDLLVVGGPHEEVQRFLHFLPYDLRGRVADTFTIDPHMTSLAAVRGHAEAIVERYEREEERRWVKEALEAHAAGGLAATGLDECLWAGSTAAIKRLLVQNGAVAPGVVCDASRWLSSTGETCPFCGAPTRHTADVVGELVELVVDEGGSVEHVEAVTPITDHLVAASLRFALPPMPESG
jgi:peptide chain release factor subunit 1